MKNTFIPEAEIVNAGTKLIIRDNSTTTRQRAHREMVILRLDGSKAEIHTQREGVGVQPSEEEHGKKTVTSFICQFFWDFVFLQANYLVSFPTPDFPWDPPLGAHTHPHPRWNLK